MRPIVLMIVCVVLGTAAAGLVPASATAADLENALRQRYALSRIEIANDRRQGAVTRRGTVLVLQQDGIPANELRVFRPMVHSPRSYIPNPARHLHNYARLEIGPGGTRTEETSAFRLPHGTRLVVLNLRTEADRIRLFAHTTEPVNVGSGRAAYGCTEFVFRLEPAVVRARDAAAVQQVIERWLKVEASGATSPAEPGGGTLARVLQSRFQLSRIEVKDPDRAGAVTRTGRVVALSVDAVPALPFQVKEGRHVPEFARVAVASDGAVERETAPLSLPRGTKLVVLDLAVTEAEARIQAHTAEPLGGASVTSPTYGCVEFVFQVRGAPALEPVECVVHRIEHWLAWTPEERLCAPGIDPVCAEP